MELSLIKSALKHDDELFVQLIMSKKEKLIRIAYKYTLNDAIVEDVLSETIYQAYKNRKQCKQPEYFDTWLIRILINNCLKEIKQQSKNYELMIDIEDKNIQDIPLKTLVYSLSEPERTILVLYFFEKATFKEISEVLNMPESTIKTKYYNILKKLRIEFMEVDYE